MRKVSCKEINCSSFPLVAELGFKPRPPGPKFVFLITYRILYLIISRYLPKANLLGYKVIFVFLGDGPWGEIIF